MNTLLLSFIAPLIFFVLKLANNAVRYSDTNTYFYTAFQLLKGKLLYRDIFFTNFPLFPYLSSFYLFILKNKIELYYLTASVEVSVTSILIFHIMHNKSKSIIVSLTAQLIYLFSFIILSTSDHQTGVFLASLFSVIAYAAYVGKRSVLVGVCLALTILTKAYYAPIIISFFSILLLKEKKLFLEAFMGFCVVLGIVLIPFLLLSKGSFVSDVWGYSLFRSQGLEKTTILSFFIGHDILLLLLFIFAIVNYKKNLLFFLINLSSFAMIILYKDVYYLYFNVMIPFIALSFGDAVQTIKERRFLFAAYGLVMTLIFISVFVYYGQYLSLQKINNIDDMVKIIKAAKPNHLYGVTDVAPALSYLTGVPLVDDIVDTNENLYRSKRLDAATLTNDAISSKSILITKGAVYPNNNINNLFLTSVFNVEKVQKSCSLLGQYPIYTEGAINRIALLKCY